VFTHNSVFEATNKKAESGFVIYNNRIRLDVDMALEITKRYSWTPLPSTRHTRLVQLHTSDSFEQSLECSIITTCVDDPCKYRALSYAWGEIKQDGSHLSAVLHCDGMPTRVTQHLNMALKRIRASTTTWYRKLPIWVDAISIAQNDPEEKAQQVLMISEIFGNCRHLTIWLGELISEKDDALCSQVAAKFHQWEYEGVEVELSAPEQSFLTTVLERSWFQRRWIIQEVLVANTSGLTPYFRIGDYGWSWPFMVYIVEKTEISEVRTKFLLIIRRMVDDNSIHGAFAGPKNRSRDLLNASRRPLYQSIVETLHVFEAAKCYDPRDRLFALLSMGWGPGKFSVDYTTSFEDVYVEFAIALVRATNDDFLPAVLASSSCRKARAPARLPSWVPDWQSIAEYNSKIHQATVQRSVANTARSEINEHYGDARSISSDKALILHNALLLSVCDHLLKAPATECVFCGLRNSSGATHPRDNEPCSHSRFQNEIDCEDCTLRNPLAAHSLAYLASLQDRQFICLMPEAQMALVLRHTHARVPCNVEGYVIEDCCLIPSYNPATAFSVFWQTPRDLPRCEVTIV
jgi:hypothetical protein